MRVNREKFLATLERVSAGLTDKDVIEQSSCFLFHGKRVCTFNDEVFCSIESPLGEMTGAVSAKPLLELLSKLDDEIIDVSVAKSGAELSVKGKGRRSGVRMEAQVSAAIDAIESPGQWLPLGDEFCQAVGVVHPCAATTENKFYLTCVHITPDFVEACDQFQIARYLVKVPMTGDALVRASAISAIVSLGMIEFGLSDAWLHFRNADGLVFSCRRFMDKYPVLDKYLDMTDATKIVLPGSLEEVVSRAEIFSGASAVGNYLLVTIKENALLIKGQGVSGWYEEKKEIQYAGEPLSFVIAPKLLLSVSKKTNECRMRPGRLMVDLQKYFYSTSTVAPEEVVVKTQAGE